MTSDPELSSTPQSQADEYTALRAELLQHVQTRAVVLGFTFTALGALSGVALAKPKPHEACSHAPTGLMALALLVVAAGAHFTSRLNERTDLIGHYIKTKVKSHARWEEYLDSPDAKERYRSTSRGFAFYYGVLLVGAAGEWGVSQACRGAWDWAAIAAPALLALWFTVGLYRHRSRAGA